MSIYNFTNNVFEYVATGHPGKQHRVTFMSCRGPAAAPADLIHRRPHRQVDAEPAWIGLDAAASGLHR
jgi:hypothetical protein